jgi:chorismate synthase
MTNGAPLVLSAAMKPISTLKAPLASVDLATRQPEEAAYERSDVCAVPAASVVVEAVVATELAAAMVEQFGGDSLAQMHAAYEAWRRKARDL